MADEPLTPNDGEALEPSAWRPISEAPQDGTRVLLFVPTNAAGQYQVGYRREGLPWIVGHSFSYDTGEPTHFMHLPAPPVTKESPHD